MLTEHKIVREGREVPKCCLLKKERVGGGGGETGILRPRKDHW
jgi:hypothetical protein